MHAGASRLLLLLFTALLLLSATHAPPPAAAEPGASVFGVNSHLGTRHGDQQTVGQGIDALAQAETGWVREEIQWGLLDPNRSGEYLAGRWELLDTVIEEQTARGINIIGLLNDAPGAAPPDTAGFVRFARDAVRRYPQIQYWEIWNEPANPLYWNQPREQAIVSYTALLKAVSQAIREVNPQAQIISGGIVPTNADFLRGIHANGGWGAFDIVGIHPYVDPYTPEAGQIGSGGDLSKIRMLVDAFGTKPIWATEFGWSTGHASRLAGGGSPATPEEQANYLVRGATLLRAAGVERIIWYKLKDENEDGTNQYGLFEHASGRTDFSQPKPAFAAFATLNRQLAQATNPRPLTLGQSSIVLDFEQPLEWRPGPPLGSLRHSTALAHRGSTSGALSYTFSNTGGGGNDWVGLSPPEEIPIPGQPTRMGIWVHGNGSGHELKVWLRDANNEVLQFRLGIVGTGGWRFLSRPINVEVPAWDRMTDFGTPGNGRLDYPIRFVAFVYDDNPNSETGSGTIHIDDLTALSPARGVRFDKGDGVVDVLWALGSEQVRLPTTSDAATLVDRSGTAQTMTASNGAFTLDLTERPLYLHHQGGPTAPPPPTPQPTPEPPPAPAPPGNPLDETPPAPADGTFGHPAMERTWQRTDLPVRDGAPGLQPRSWIWGPAPITARTQEPYAEGTGGERVVQYFDKSRMEINNPAQGTVTNGLLALEMIEGRIQVGDAAYVEHTPSAEAVAGDPAAQNPNAPTYRSFRSVSFPINAERAPNRVGQTVTEVLQRDGSTTQNADLARYGVTIDFYSEQLGHNVPGVFTDFLNRRGVVYENGGFSQQQIIDWLFVTGYPISEPYWARVRVGGEEKDVLMQAFQRRVLTYTPTNDPAWRVEMGNVGQHYLRWRYGE
jgi:hypothetical protein